jgi:DNA ligase-1
MKIFEILQRIKDTPGSNDKKQILELHVDNELLKKVLIYATDSLMPFHLVKVPKTKKRFPGSSEQIRWNSFFDVADLCASRAYTGNIAIEMMESAFCVVTIEEEKWMRKILKKHLAIGASAKTINKVFPGLVGTFEVSLANKFQEKQLAKMGEIAIEPKLDGIRCFSIVEGEEVNMFARSGKLITNFESTLAPELKKLGDGCYDGELMGEDFISLMRQAYRKDDVDTSQTYLALFDYLPLAEWNSRKSRMTCAARYEELLDRMALKEVNLDLLQPIERFEVYRDYESIKAIHDEFVSDGYEGAMIKDLNAPYKFGRGWEVMKFKAFHDVDLPIQGFEEGTGKHRGKLGAIVVEYKGTKVKVGSGFSDELREQIWRDQTGFISRVVEIRYQEVTPDGSLRFPTFVCFRNDR